MSAQLRDAWAEGWHTAQENSEPAMPAYDSDAEIGAWSDGYQVGARFLREQHPSDRLRTNPYARRNMRRGAPRPPTAFEQAGLTGICARCRRPIRESRLYCDTVCASS